MKRAKRLCRKVRLTTLKTMAAIAVCLTFAYPLYEKAATDECNYFEIELNGEVIGATADEGIAQAALLQARKQVTQEAGTLVYMEPVLQVTKRNKLWGTRMNETQVVEAMYSILKESAVMPKQEAYTVKINETTIHLASKEEVVQLLEATKNRFDVNDEFTIELVEDTESPFTALTANISKPGVESKENPVVFAAMGSEEIVEEDEPVFEDGLLSVGFEQRVEIVESYVSPDQLTTVQEAYDLLTKEKEENEIYVVMAGDCMSIIAEKHNLPTSKLYELNEGITEHSILQIDQELIITVPEPELSVLMEEEVTYEEDYQEDVIYVNNDSWYTTTQVVQQEGTVGHREVVAVVSSRNGKEVEREIIHENILTESLPKIVERGTMTPPNYIKPISGGTLTSYFGPRWGRLHAGVDWGISTGSTVVASSGGRVVSAGWNGGYGYSVLIQHPDGRKTRYAHLSKITVSNGEYVTQGERIGLSGNTGNSTGPHLHFEMIINGSAVNPLNYIY